MKLSELLGIIKEGENQTVEFKSKVNGFGKTLCAFLNTNGGVVLLGVEDDGSIAGIGKEGLEKAENIISSIHPRPKVHIETIKIDGKLLAIVKVEKSRKLHTYRNVAYVRIGTSDRPLSIDELYEKAGEALFVKFDELINEFADISDIEKNTVRKFLEERKRIRNVKIPEMDFQTLAEALRITLKGKVTNAGILFFSKNPQRYFPYVKIRVIELLSLERREILDEKEIGGNLWDMFERGVETLMEKLKKSVIIKGMKRTERYEIHPEIIREALANAICHRNYFDTREILVFVYPDRIEIENPGSFPPGVSPENPVHKPRNPLISQYFYDIGVIEKYGSGIYAMRDIAEKNGTDLNYVIGENTTKLIVKRGVPEFVGDEISRKILQVLRIKESCKAKEIAETIGVSEDTILRRMKTLIAKGMVEKRGRGKSTAYSLR